MYQARETKQRKAQVVRIEQRTGLDGFSAVVDFALSHTIATLGAERPKGAGMYTTDSWERAKAEADRTGDPIWRHADGTYAVSDYLEMQEVADPDGWTEVTE